MGINLGSTPITIPGIAKILRGETLIYSSAPAGPVNYTLTQKSVLEFDTDKAAWLSACKIDDTHLAVAYEDADGDGKINVFAIGEDGAISQLSSLEHDTSDGDNNSLILIDALHLVLAYAGVGSDGYVKTFVINENYSLTEIDSLEHDSVQGVYNVACKIDDTHFALCYKPTSSYGIATVKTFEIDGSYNITQVDALVIGGESDYVGSSLGFALLDDSHLIASFSVSASGQTTVKVVKFDEDCDNLAVVGTPLTISNAYGANALIKLDNTHVVLSTSLNPTSTTLHVLAVDESYDLSEIDSLEHDDSAVNQPSLSLIDSTHFIHAYEKNSNSSCIVKTFSIDGSYNLTEIDDFTSDESNGNYSTLLTMSASLVVVGYSGADSDGYIKVLELD